MPADGFAAREIPVRSLGASGLQVTRLGLGLAALGRPGYINLGRDRDLGRDRAPERMRDATFRVLDAARDGGIRYLDAARSYGRSEEFLSKWFHARGIPPDAFVIGSKWGYTYTAGWQIEADRHEVKEHSLAVLDRQWTESIALLGRRLSLHQIHSATESSGVLDDPAVVRRLAALRADSGVRIGLTLSGPDQARTLRRALDVRVDGESLFDVVQATWNLLERSVGEALAEAHAAGLGVIVKEALANGRLAGGRGVVPGGRPAPLRAEAERLGVTPDALAIAAVLAQPWADVVLSGAATPDQLRSNLRALDIAWDEETDERLSSLAEPAAEYWSARSEMDWN
jgi:aryl-alcohol dehydrogenase-like predicted oxidoreductase